MDLNEPYLRMNTEYIKTGQRDYFSSMGPPETPAPPPPSQSGATYVNTKAGSSPDNSYLKMSPNAGKVFYDPSNTGTDGPKLNQINLSDAMFKKSPPSNNFDKNNPRQSKKPEEMPMLKHINELVSSDESETEGGVKDEQDHPTSTTIQMTPVKTDNRNYVNVPSMGQQKVSPSDVERGYGGGAKDAFSNPTYLGVKSYSDKNKS